jgi:hypothetical protein
MELICIWFLVSLILGPAAGRFIAVGDKED